MKEVYVKKGEVIKKIQENIASQYVLIGWKVVSDKEKKEFSNKLKAKNSEKENSFKIEE